MTNINTAKTPWGLLYFSVVSFFYFFFFSTRQGGTPLFRLENRTDIVKHYYFIWNNIISTKLKKVERTIILNPYLNLSGVSP